MADITILSSDLSIVGDGQKGFRVLCGCGQFNGTDVTATLPVPGLNRVDGATFTCLAVQDEGIAVNETVSSAGTIIPTSGKLNIMREDLEPTSGLKFFFTIRGR